jgi:hypothetical protein
LEIRDREK